tara:strand:- start:219 stop:401 length:183 start_codon:yes stop_codon:yes gene_type:complete
VAIIHTVTTGVNFTSKPKKPTTSGVERKIEPRIRVRSEVPQTELVDTVALRIILAEPVGF